MSPLLRRIVYYHNYRRRRACARGLVFTVITRARARPLGAAPRPFDRSKAHVRGAATGTRARRCRLSHTEPIRAFPLTPAPFPSYAAPGWRDGGGQRINNIYARRLFGKFYRTVIQNSAYEKSKMKRFTGCTRRNRSKSAKRTRR